MTARTVRELRDEAREQARLIVIDISREMEKPDADWRLVQRYADWLARVARDTDKPVTVGEVMERW